MRLLDRLRRHRRRPRKHPTPDQALDAVRATNCMYSPISKCPGPLRSAGLRGDDDFYAVLVCKAHYGRLRQMPERDLDELEHVLLAAYKSSHDRAMVGSTPAGA